MSANINLIEAEKRLDVLRIRLRTAPEVELPLIVQDFLKQAELIHQTAPKSFQECLRMPMPKFTLRAREADRRSGRANRQWRPRRPPSAGSAAATAWVRKSASGAVATPTAPEAMLLWAPNCARRAGRAAVLGV
jgi:hypothetical protein